MISMASRTGRHLQRYIDGCRQVVGCIPYRFRKSKAKAKPKSNGGSPTPVEELVEVLLVSSQKGEAWLFPKGGWENDESIEIAARRETLEEAGVIGEVKSELGRWRYKSKSQEKYHEGYMFSLLVKEQLDVWPEKNARRRVWMTVSEAREKCPHSWMIEALDVFQTQVLLLLQQQQQQQHAAATTTPEIGVRSGGPSLTAAATAEEGQNCAMEFFLKRRKKKKLGEGGEMMVRRRHST